MSSARMADERSTTIGKVVAWLERSAAYAEAHPKQIPGAAHAYKLAAHTLRAWPEVLDEK